MMVFVPTELDASPKFWAVCAGVVYYIVTNSEQTQWRCSRALRVISSLTNSCDVGEMVQATDAPYNLEYGTVISMISEVENGALYSFRLIEE